MKRFTRTGAGRRLGLVAAGAAGAAVLVTVPFTPATAAPGAAAATSSGSYRVIDLGTLPGATDSTASAINERGDVVGNSGGRAVLWREGRIVDLGTPAGSFSSAVDVNERGAVIGNIRGGDADRAFLWRRGRMVDLTLPGDGSSSAKAINDRGEVLGSSGSRPVLWRADGTVVELTATGLGTINDVNNSGQLVGSVSPDGMNSIPVLSSHGRTTVLSDDFGSASAINDRGEVTGYFFTGSAGSFVWRQGRLTRIPLLPDMPAYTMQAQAINDRGQVVGSAAFEGFLWDGGTLTVLPHLYGNGPAAFGINNRGQIVGQVGTTPENLQPHAVLLLQQR